MAPSEPLDVDGGVGAPDALALSPAYPNPARGAATRVDYALPAAGPVTLEVFNTLGQRVAVLVDEALPAGVYTATLDTGRLASGLYVYRLQAAGGVVSRKVAVVR